MLKQCWVQQSFYNGIKILFCMIYDEILRVQYGCRLAVQIPVADVNGDNIRCRWSTGSECISVCSVLPSATLNKVRWYISLWNWPNYVCALRWLNNAVYVRAPYNINIDETHLISCLFYRRLVRYIFHPIILLMESTLWPSLLKTSPVQIFPLVGLCTLQTTQWRQSISRCVHACNDMNSKGTLFSTSYI